MNLATVAAIPAVSVNSSLDVVYAVVFISVIVIAVVISARR